MLVCMWFIINFYFVSFCLFSSLFVRLVLVWLVACMWCECVLVFCVFSSLSLFVCCIYLPTWWINVIIRCSVRVTERSCNSDHWCAVPVLVCSVPTATRLGLSVFVMTRSRTWPFSWVGWWTRCMQSNNCSDDFTRAAFLSSFTSTCTLKSSRMTRAELFKDGGEFVEERHRGSIWAGNIVS